MGKIVRPCSTCGEEMTGFNTDVEGTGVDLCLRCAVEYQAKWRPKHSPVEPDVLAYLAWKKVQEKPKGDSESKQDYLVRDAMDSRCYCPKCGGDKYYLSDSSGIKRKDGVLVLENTMKCAKCGNTWSYEEALD